MNFTEKTTPVAPKRQQGFTLIEIIVVAVIVLILSAVAIPMYNGYVRQAKQDVVDNLAETAAAAANAYWRRTGSTPPASAFVAHTGEFKLSYDNEKHEIWWTNDDSVRVRDINSGGASKDCTGAICGAAKYK